MAGERVISLDALRDMFVKAGPLAPAALEVAARLLALEMTADVQKNRLRTGPPYLRVRTGRLIQSVLWRTDRVAGGAVARTGTNVVYARPHELGFDGIVNVRAHARRGHTVRSHARHMRIRAKHMFAHTLRDISPRSVGYAKGALAHVLETGKLPTITDVKQRAV